MHLLRPIVSTGGLLLAAVAGLSAQSPDWGAALLVQPNPSPFISDWERNPGIAVLTVNYTGTAPATYQVEATVTSLERGDVGAIRGPMITQPSGPVTQGFFARDVWSWETVRRSDRALDIVRRTGRIPEGRYRMCATVLLDGKTAVARDCAEFAILLPDPPQLISPRNDEVVTGLQPVFQWTPVLAPPDVRVAYRVKIVELFRLQQPSAALAANIPVLETDVPGTPFLIYPLNGLPLEDGKRYAWRVTAVDADGQQLSREGVTSEIGTFMASTNGRFTLASTLADTLTLVPGVAVLRGLSTASTSVQGSIATVNGALTLDLLQPSAGSVAVTATNLAIDTQSGAPVITGGSVKGKLSGDLLGEQMTSAGVAIAELQYSPSTGLTASAEWRAPAGAPIPLEGRLQLTSTGLFGVLTADAPEGGSLAAIGADPVRVLVRGVRATLPAGELSLTGGLELFGEDAQCGDLYGVLGDSAALGLHLACTSQRRFPLAPGSTRATLQLASLSGPIALDLRGGSLTYALNASAQLRLDGDDGASCGATLALALSNSGLSADSVAATCDVSDANVDLGWLALRLSRLRLDRFAYTPGSGFDWRMIVDVAPSVPAVSGLHLPSIDSVVVTQHGLAVPALDAPITAPPVRVGGFGLAVTHVRLPAFTLSWASWQARAATGFRFGLDAALSAPELPVAAPACLVNGTLATVNVDLSDGLLRAALANRQFTPECVVSLAPGTEFALDSVSGALALRLAASPVVEELPTVSGSFRLPSYFTCTSGVGSVEIAGVLRMSAKGRLSGEATGVAVPCPIDLAAARLTFAPATLDFTNTDSAQSIVLTAGASAAFTLGGSSSTATGNVSVDVINGRLLSGALEFAGPLDIALPRENPLLTFRVAKARLDASGLLVDGRQALLLDGAPPIAVTFDNLLVNPRDLAITSGRVQFDAPFALDVGLDAATGLTWRAVAPADSFALAVGLRAELPTQLVLDANGLSAKGQAGAKLRFQDFNLDSLRVHFSSDFALGFGPVGVSRGYAEVQLNGVRVAIVDPLGFHPSFAYFAEKAIPARLPLPTEDVAYLQLRDSRDSLLVRAQSTPNGVHITTAPGQQVSLVFPALAMGRPQPPSVDVALDVVLNEMDGTVKSGTIAARVPTASQGAFDLSSLGIPLAIDTVSYEREPGYGPYRFALGGAVTLFGDRQSKTGSTGEFAITLGTGGHLAGSVRLPVGKQIPLEQGSSKLVLAVDTVRGSFNAELLANKNRYDLTVVGGLTVAFDPAKPLAIPAELRATEKEIVVTRLDIPNDSLAQRVDLGYVRLGVSNFRVPTLQYSHVTKRFSYELLFDLAFAFPGLQSLVLPPIKDVSIRADGLTIPAYEVAEFTTDNFKLGEFSTEAPYLGTTISGGLQLRPLAFRMDPLKVNWLHGQWPSDWGFRFDLAVLLGNLPDWAPPTLRNMELRLLDAGYRNGRVTGRIERVNFPEPINLGAFDLKSAEGEVKDSVENNTTEQVYRFKFGIAVHLPSFLQCAQGTTSSQAVRHDSLTLVLRGESIGIEGTVNDIHPTCPLDFGPARLALTGSKVTFADGGSAIRARLRADAALRLPGLGADTVISTGWVEYDLLDGRFVDGDIRVNQAFVWKPLDNNPFLRFVASQAKLDAAGFHFTGSGTLRLDNGATASVAFNDLVLGIPDFGLRLGSATITGDLALGVGINQGGQLSWGITERTAPNPAGASFRLELPQSITLSKSGVALSGSAVASLTYGDSSFNALAANFSNGFTIGVKPVGVSAGRADFVLGGVTVAHVDPTGFWPGNIFGVLPIPEKLGLPTEDVAYLTLKDSQGNLLVETATEPNGLRLSTRPGQSVQLVVPALAKQNAAAPTVSAQFSIVVNPVNLGVVSGEVKVDAPQAGELFSLDDLGLPLRVTSVSYAATQGGQGAHALRLSARVALPESFNGMDVVLNDITVTSSGLSGTAELGTYKEVYDPALPSIISHQFLGDTLAVALTGVHATFGTGASSGTNAVKLSGVITTRLFTEQQGSGGAGGGGAGAGQGAEESVPPVPVFFTASLGAAEGFSATVDPSRLPHPDLPIGLATFTPMPLDNEPAIKVIATQTELALQLGGVLKVPTLSSDFAVTIQKLKVGTGGVQLPTVSISGLDPTQKFELFGAEFTLRDSTISGQSTPVYPALALSYQGGVLGVELSGMVTFMENTTRYVGLRVRSDGTVSLAGANLLSKPLVIVKDRFSIESIAIANNALRVDADIVLPEPLDVGAAQRVMFEIGANGQISGGANLVLVNEQPGLAGAIKKIDAGIATMHLRRLGVNLDFANLRGNSAVEVVTDIYVAGDEQNLIRVGSVNGNSVSPGLRIGFDGNVTWGNIALAHEFTFTTDVVNLTISNVTAANTGSALEVGFGGKLELVLAAVSGSLEFQDFVLSSKGDVRFAPSGIKGGSFSIAETVKLQVHGFSYSSTPTTITVADGPSGGGEPATSEVQVASYLQFGGSIDVVGVFNGGVKRFLMYRDVADNGVHLVVDSAALGIPEVLDFRADLRYDQTSTGFNMLLGARGELLKAYSVMLVGNVEKEGSDVRAGMFLAAGVTIPIVPGALTLSGLGGGFFYNPRPQTLNLVRQMANVSSSAGDKLGPPPAGKFAAMLYASASIAGSGTVSAAEGRVLLTLTDKVFQLDGALTFLAQTQKLYGEAHLAVGLQQAYAQGNVALIADYGAPLQASVGLEFFVFGKNEWGVLGNGKATIVGAINAEGNLAVGPTGFFADLTAQGGYTVSVIKIDGTFNARAWYATKTNDLGAYVDLGVEASVVGVAGVKGKLAGVLLLNPSPAVYAGADLTAYVLGISKQVGVWVSWDPQGIRGGIGRDPALDAAITQAQQIADRMRADADAAKVAVDAARAELAQSQIIVSDAELLAAYQRVQGWSKLGFRVWSGLVETQAGGIGYEPYLGSYVDALLQVGAPADTAVIRGLGVTTTNYLSQIESERSAVLQKLAAVQVRIDELKTQASMPRPENPVGAVSLTEPQFVESTDPSGRTIRSLVPGTGPSWTLDEAKAQQGVQEITVARDAAENARGELLARIVALDSGLTQVRAVTTAASAGSLLSYARLHSSAAAAAEEQYARHYNVLRQRYDWFDAKLAWLHPLEQTVRGYIEGATQQLIQQGAASNMAKLSSLAYERARLLDAMVGGDSILARYEAERSAMAASTSDNAQRAQWFKTKADAFGRSIWFDLARVGMIDGFQASDLDADRAADSAEVRGARIRLAHDTLSASLSRLAASQAELTGVLYDLYDRYLAMDSASTPAKALVVASRAGLPAVPQTGLSSGQSQLVTLGQSQLIARRNELRQALTVPKITSAQAQVTNYGYYSKVALTWSGSHPLGVYEFLAQYPLNLYSSNTGFSGSLFSAGSVGSITRHLFQRAPQAATVTHQVKVGVRGGAGFHGMGSTSYTVSFTSKPLATPTTTTRTLATDVTPPAAPVVAFPGRTKVMTQSYAFGVYPITAPAYWTADSTGFQVSWSASDAESGIAEYEYAIFSPSAGEGTTTCASGSGSGFVILGSGGNTQSCNTLGSGSEPTPTRPWTSVGGRLSITVRDLALAQGGGVKVGVRAKNGAGLVSSIGYSAPIYYDGTRPAFPAGATISAGTVATTSSTSSTSKATLLGGGSSTGTVYGTRQTFSFTPGMDVARTLAACPVAPPALSGAGSGTIGVWGSGSGAVLQGWNGVFGVSGTTSSAGIAPSVMLTRPNATDAESEVVAYHWRADTMPAAAYAAGGWTALSATNPTFTVSGAPLDYKRSFYVSLVAENAAGLVSAPISYGPFTIPDPTPPTAPVFCVGTSGAGSTLSIKLDTLSSDAETGLAGYQYRVRAGGSVVRNWNGSSLDFTKQQAGSAGSTIQLTGFQPVSGQQYTVDIRAANGAGQWSDIIASGTVAVDQTPPPLPTIVAGSIFGLGASRSRVLIITVPDDPESGIRSAYLAVGTGELTANLQPWQPIAGPAAGQFQVPLPPLPVPSGAPVWVHVVTVNGAGQPSAVARIRTTTP